MPNGYTGKILRVDLTSGEISIDRHDDVFYRTFVGGAGIIAYYLLKEVPPTVDALGPENHLIVANGVLTGIPVGGDGSQRDWRQVPAHRRLGGGGRGWLFRF